MSFYRIRPRSGTASQWNLVNPVLGEREIGFEVPDGGVGSGEVKMKMGDGTTAWADLPYAIIAGISPDDIVHNGETNDSTKIVGADAFYALTQNVMELDNDVTELTNSLNKQIDISSQISYTQPTNNTVTVNNIKVCTKGNVCCVTIYVTNTGNWASGTSVDIPISGFPKPIISEWHIGLVQGANFIGAYKNTVNQQILLRNLGSGAITSFENYGISFTYAI